MTEVFAPFIALFVLAALVAAVGFIILRRSPDHYIGQLLHYAGWGTIGVIVAGIFVGEKQGNIGGFVMIIGLIAGILVARVISNIADPHSHVNVEDDDANNRGDGW